MGGSDLIQCLSVASALSGLSSSTISRDTVDGIGGRCHRSGLSLVGPDVHRRGTTISSKGVVQSEADLLVGVDVRNVDPDDRIWFTGFVERTGDGVEQAE